MKSLLLVLLLFSLQSNAQVHIDPVILPIDSTTGAVQFREIIQTDPALDTKALMQRARTWVATAYQSANDVVQQYDPEAGLMIVKGQFPIDHVYHKGKPLISNVAVFHMLTVEAKPGRYRVTMNNFEQGAPTGPRFPIRANHGSMSEEEYMAEVRKQAANSGMEKLILRTAEKNLDSGLQDARLYTADFKAAVLTILNSLKTQMQKKSEKDW